MRYFTVLFAFISSFSFGQNYHLLPDTCTHCSWIFTMGTAQIFAGTYTLQPENDTLYQGNVYMRIPASMLIGVRQSGNKVLAAIYVDTTQEYLIQDWDADIGDTIFGLYDEMGIYDAVFLQEDSSLMNDGNYHRFRIMKGINGAVVSEDWYIEWHERGLCATESATFWPSGFGGLLYNNRMLNLGAYYNSPHPHTPDPRYNLNQTVSGCSIDGAFNSLMENEINTISIYPNPSDGIIHLGETTFEISEIEILDLNGKSLLKSSADSKVLDISNFQNGIYFLRVKTTENAYLQTKIMKTE